MPTAINSIVGMLKRSAWKLSLLFLIGLPAAWAVGYSTLYSLGGIGRLSTGWTIDHWVQAYQSIDFLQSILLSLSLAAAATIMILSMTGAALLFIPKQRNNPLLLASLTVLFGTPTVVISSLISHWFSGGGLFSRLAFHLGMQSSPTDFPALTNDRWSVGIFLALCLSMLPLAFLYFSRLWDILKIDRYCALAESLGSSYLQGRLQVALPMLLRRGSPMIVLMFLLLLGSFEIPLLLGRQSPQMFSVAIQRRSGVFDLSDKPESFVMANTYFVICSLLLVLYIRQRRRRHAKD